MSSHMEGYLITTASVGEGFLQMVRLELVLYSCYQIDRYLRDFHAHRRSPADMTGRRHLERYWSVQAAQLLDWVNNGGFGVIPRGIPNFRRDPTVSATLCLCVIK